jgi:hypothetical protein
MTDWNDKARHLIDLAQKADRPTAGDAARIRQALESRLLLDPSLASPILANGVASSAKVAASKLLIAFGIGGGFGLASSVIVRAAFEPAEQTSRPAQRAAERPTTAVAPGPGIRPSEAVPADNVRGTRSDRGSFEPRAGDASGHSVRSGGAGARVRADDLRIELDGLRRAQELLHRGERAEALSVLDTLSRASASRVLIEEREATRLIALCADGKVEARELDGFAQRFPKSVHYARVKAACSQLSNVPAPSTEYPEKKH